MTPPRSNRRTGQGFATRAIHLGYDPAGAQGALSPPVFMTSTYTFETVEEGLAIAHGEKDGYTSTAARKTRRSRSWRRASPTWKAPRRGWRWLPAWRRFRRPPGRC